MLHTNFKQIRKRVVSNTQRQNINQNQPINPIKKLSFRGIKKNVQNKDQNTHEQLKGFNTPKTHKNNGSNKKAFVFDSSRSGKEDCNKFSLLLQSKGFSNNNSAAKPKTNTSRKNNTYGKENIISRRGQPVDEIHRKCRKIREKDYNSSREYGGELNSLNKLKIKLFSPLKKAVSGPQNIGRCRTLVAQFQHQSILSELDMVNISKNNEESIEFDMSPVLYKN